MDCTPIIAGAAALGTYSLIEPSIVRLRRLELAFCNLPDSFDGFTILHLSDLHAGKMGFREQRARKLLEGLSVDICVITGDFGTDYRSPQIIRNILSGVEISCGTHTVFGNTERKLHLNLERLRSELTAADFNHLENSSIQLCKGNDAIALVGIDDPFSEADNIDAAFAGVNAKGFVIALSHCPSAAPTLIDRGANLILSGHTHGGQVRLPGVGLLWTHMRENQALADGVYPAQRLSNVLGRRISDAVLVVSRGLGTSRFPIRFMCLPEMHVITLRMVLRG